MASLVMRRTTRSLLVEATAPCRSLDRCIISHAARRPFSSTKRTASISEIKVSQDRLMNDIHHTCKWGTGERWGSAETETGMCRLSLSDSDKQARDWFAETTQSLGCEVTVDEMGNQFAIRKGRSEGLATFAGSHLDTQPTGGRYDGILGVTAAVEMLRVLQDVGHESEYPIGVVNWTNEEGARFPMSMVSSGVWAGAIPLEKAHNLASVVRGENATMRSELERIGYLGSTPCSHKSTPIAAHFELHIEQGPILEKENRKIGIVGGVQAYKWFTITVTGRDCHTGTTDLGSRSDALLAASKMIVATRDIAYSGGGLASTGIIEARPGSTNTVPGYVKFSLDVRAEDDELVDTIQKRLEAAYAAIAAADDLACLKSLHPQAHNDICSVKWHQDFHSPAIKFHDDCIKCVTESARDLFGDQAESLTKPMVSGAGHDSVYTNKHVPTSMVFVPSKGGVSHNPIEYTSPEDCALGAQVLLGSVLRYDKLRSSGEFTS